jgi:lysine/ornithine N-monooxygenase
MPVVHARNTSSIFRVFAPRTYGSIARHSLVPEQLDVAIVGAGPFGLSIAAWLDDRRTRVFGAAMQTWYTLMPPDMLMRSAWEETSLSARGGRGTIDEWVAASGSAKQEPIPLALFLEYAAWFRERYVSDHDTADVQMVEPHAEGYRLQTTRGDELDVRTLVVAVGVTPFAFTPPPFQSAFGDRVEHAVSRRTFDVLGGKRVLVVGAGQAGLETAGLAANAGADVEVLARSRVNWFADREPHHPRGPLAQRLYRLAYPVVGYGPPPINRLALHPDAFAALPWGLRRRITERLLRPGGSPWVRSMVEGRVRITEGAAVTAIADVGDAVHVQLSDGSSRAADRVLLATGYRFSLDRLDWLSPAVRARIRVEQGWPSLDRGFRSTDPGVFFVGYPAEGRFGPVSRFVLGAAFSAKRLRATLDRARPRS